MKRNRILIGVGVLAVLIAVVWATSKEPAAETFRSPLGKIKMEDVDALEIRRPDDDRPTVLKKSGTAWRVTAPVDAPADQRAVTSALEKLRDLDIADRAAESKE